MPGGCGVVSRVVVKIDASAGATPNVVAVACVDATSEATVEARAASKLDANLDARVGTWLDARLNASVDAMGLASVTHGDRKSTRLNSSHEWISRMPSSA